MNGAPQHVLAILLVEDYREHADLIQAHLNRISTSSTLQWVTSEKAAVAEIAKQRYEFMIADLNLPDADGVSVIRRLRSLDEEARILAMSGYYAATIADEALSAGADEFLAKDELTMESLRRAMDKANSVRHRIIVKRRIERGHMERVFSKGSDIFKETNDLIRAFLGQPPHAPV